MAGAAARRREAAPAYREALEPSIRPRQRARPRRAAVFAHAHLGRGFILFCICLALLAAGRIAVTFAVVEKNLQTTAVIEQQQSLGEENMALEEEVGLRTATARIQSRALQLGLVPASDVRYLTVPGATAEASPP